MNFLKKIIERFTPHKVKHQTIYAIYIGENKIAIAESYPSGVTTRNNPYEIALEHSDEDFVPALKRWAQAQGEESVRTNLILNSHEYSVSLIDDPELPQTEMYDAIQWQLKDYSEIALQNSVIDFFKIPPHGLNQTRKKIYVVISKLERMLYYQNQLKKIGIQIQSIDIEELALLNLLVDQFGDKASLIFLVLQPINSNLFIINQGNIIYLRSFGKSFLRLFEEDSVGFQDKLNLELQRSLDYCYSELKISDFERLVVTPDLFKNEELISFLRQKINFNIETLDLKKYGYLHEADIAALIAIGASMQSELA